MSRGKLLNTNLSNITSDVSDLQLGLQSAEDSITNAFEVSAPIEKSPSTHNYAVGDYLIWNGALRRVTSAISVGDALTNSNTTLTNSGKELSQINADLSDILIEFHTTVNVTHSGGYGGWEDKVIDISNVAQGRTLTKVIPYGCYKTSDMNQLGFVSIPHSEITSTTFHVHLNTPSTGTYIVGFYLCF